MEASVVTPKVLITESPSRLFEGRPHIDLELRFNGLPPHSVETLKALAPRLPDLLESVRDEDFAERTKLLARAFRPRIPLEEIHLQFVLNHHYLRNRFLETVELLTATQVGSLSTPPANPAHNMGQFWREQGLIFAPAFDGVRLYPRFQFGPDGKPIPLVKELLTIFRSHDLSDWDIAFWFIGSNGWLDGDKPIDLIESLDSETESLLRDAAEQETLKLA
jgi:hypothetical protein